MGACDLVVIAKREIEPRLRLEQVREDLESALASRRR
jgi:hypothetical protein